MNVRLPTRAKLGKIIVSSLITMFLVIELYPLVWLVLSSFKTEPEFIKPMFALPESIHIQNYLDAIHVTKIGQIYFNTVVVTFSSVAISLVLSAMAAFALAKMKWRLSRTVALYFRLGMFIPAFVMLLPQFLMFKSMGLLNTLYVLIIIFSCGISMPIYLLSGFYKYVPDELLEAAVIDGCGIYRCFYHVAVPLMSNGFFTVVLLSFFIIWNDLLISQTFVSSQSKKLLQVALATFVGDRSYRRWGPTFALISIAVVPTLFIYLVFNKKIIGGLSAGALKG